MHVSVLIFTLTPMFTIFRSNLHILIRCLCKGILEELKVKMSSGESKAILESWLKAFEYMDILVTVLKDKHMHKSKTNLIAYLKVRNVCPPPIGQLNLLT